MNEPQAPDGAPVLIRVESISKKFSRGLQLSLRHGMADIFRQLVTQPGPAQLRTEEFWALREVSFTVRKGEAVAVVGNNGAGKSTLQKLLMGRLLPTSGRITTEGRIVGITQLGLGFNPVQSGKENIFINAALLGMSRKRTEQLLDQIVSFADIADFIDAPVQTYSAGMRARLGFAVAAHLDPDILLLDEVLAVGDLAFKRKCRMHVKNFIRGGGTLVLVSHDMHAVQTISSRVIVLDHGRVLFDGDVVEGVQFYYRMQREAGLEIDEREPSAAGGAERDGIGSPAPVAGLEQDSQAAAESQPGGSEAAREAATRAFEMGEESDTADEALDAPSSEGTGVAVAVAAAPKTEATMSATVINAPRIVPTLSDNYPVAIESVELYHPWLGGLQHGEAAELLVHYVARQDMEGIGWGFTICTRDLATHIGTAFFGFEEGEVVRLRSGRGKLRCRLPKLPLLPGSYALKVGISDLESGGALAEVGWEDLPHYFVVSGAATRANNLHGLLGDLVSIDVDWQP